MIRLTKRPGIKVVYLGVLLVLLFGGIVHQALWAKSGLAILKTNLYAASIGRGGAGIADISGAYSIFSNSAGVLGLDKPQLAASHYIYFLETRVENVSLALPLENIGIGFGYMYFVSSNIPYYSDAPNDEIPTNFFKVTTTMPIITLGIRGDKIRHAISFKFLTYKYFELKSTVYMFDYGLQYHKKDSANYYGFVLRNIGTKLSFFREDVLPPYYVQLGYSRALKHWAKVSSDLRYEFLDGRIKLNIGGIASLTENMEIMAGWEKVNFKEIKNLDNVSGGLVFYFGNLKVIYAFRYHSRMGISHSIDISLSPRSQPQQ